MGEAKTVTTRVSRSGNTNSVGAVLNPAAGRIVSAVPNLSTPDVKPWRGISFRQKILDGQQQDDDPKRSDLVRDEVALSSH